MFKNWQVYGLVIAIAFIFFSCGQDKPVSPTVADDTVVSTIDQLAKSGSAVHWGYSEENGPNEWCGLSPDFSACCEGITQSPVDINRSAVRRRKLPKLQFGYDRTDVEIEHNGHPIHVGIPEDMDMGIQIGGKQYRLLQFHFHARSEHAVKGRLLPMEMHLVHQADDGSLAVVGVFIVKGNTNNELDKIFSDLPQHDGDHYEVYGIKPAKLLPNTMKTFRYSGSLTTPPCSEAVRWIVMAKPISASAENIAAFTSLFNDPDHFPHGNRRPVQPLNGRVIGTDLKF